MKLTSIDKDTLLAIGLVAAYVVCCSTAEAVEQDKSKHFAASAAMAAAATLVFEGRTESPIIYGIAASFAVGVAKEVYDKAHPQSHTASGADLAADLVGATAGAWLGHGIYVRASDRSVSVGITKDF